MWMMNFKTLQDSDPWTVEGTVFRLSIYRFHSIFFWAGSLLIGMWLGRWNVHYRSSTKAYVLRWNQRCSGPGMYCVATGSLYARKHLGRRLMGKRSTGYYSCRFSCRFTSLVCVESLLQLLAEASC